jgi:Fic family protein
MSKHLKLLTAAYLDAYIAKVKISWLEVANHLRSKNVITCNDFLFYHRSSATYSSNIEGNSIDFDTYLKNKKFNIKSLPKEMAEIDDLVFAYNFAMKNKLTKTNLLHAHKILSRTILSVPALRGHLRKQQVGIFSSGDLVYMSIDYKDLPQEFTKFFSDIRELLSRNLSYKECFYYASMIHLIFEKLHPFLDGNGRVGRLLEKWFLSELIGENAWSIQSEKYYALHREEYYKKIHIGVDYYSIRLDKSLPFLLMLPASL